MEVKVHVESRWQVITWTDVDTCLTPVCNINSSCITLEATTINCERRQFQKRSSPCEWFYLDMILLELFEWGPFSGLNFAFEKIWGNRVTNHCLI